MQKRLRKICSFLFAFFASFFLLMIVVLSSARFTLLSPQYFLDQLESNNYYEGTAMQLNRMIRQEAGPAGLPSELFDQYIKAEDIHEEMIAYEKAVLNRNEAAIDTSTLKVRLNEDIKKYASEKKIVINAAMQKNIDVFMNSILEKYQYLTQFPYLDVYASVTKMYAKAYVIAIPVLLTAFGIVCLLLYKLYINCQRRKRYFAYALIGSGLLCAALPMYLYINRFFEKININPQYMYNLMVNMMKDFLIANIISGMVLIVAGLLIAFIKVKSKKKKYKKIYTNSTILEGIEKA